MTEFIIYFIPKIKELRVNLFLEGKLRMIFLQR